MNNMVIWYDVPVIIGTKQGGIDYGDLPAVVYNAITNKFMPVVNPRGRAYATRNRLKFRKRK